MAIMRTSATHPLPVDLQRRIILCLTMFIGIIGIIALIALKASARSVPEQSTNEREFVGTINKTLRVRIRLSQSGKILSGSYAYEKIGASEKIGRNLRLNGAMTSEKEFYLNEFDESSSQTRKSGGKQTGRFEGKFVSKDWLEGTWYSTSTKKEMPFSAWAIDGKQIPAANAHDRLSGQYRRVDKRGSFDRDSSELNVWLLKDGQVRVAGDSSWVGNASTGNVNVGTVDGIFALQDSKLFFKDGDGDDDCRFTITFGVDSLLVTDDNLRCGGLNVSFDGKYRKVGPKGTGRRGDGGTGRRGDGEIGRRGRRGCYDSLFIQGNLPDVQGGPHGGTALQTHRL
jgi:hypothetical protein